mmetsp:Transcript_24904/g.74463  ORF Transcript_24904/g.74463 Transcript_24904/m.74463 type:complete len:134 (+) Transcript_24904:189-590(+)
MSLRNASLARRRGVRCSSTRTSTATAPSTSASSLLTSARPACDVAAAGLSHNRKQSVPQAWTPMTTIKQLLLDIQALLVHPRPPKANGLKLRGARRRGKLWGGEAHSAYRHNSVEYERKVREQAEAFEGAFRA